MHIPIYTMIYIYICICIYIYTQLGFTIVKTCAKHSSYVFIINFHYNSACQILSFYPHSSPPTPHIFQVKKQEMIRPLSKCWAKNLNSRPCTSLEVENGGKKSEAPFLVFFLLRGLQSLQHRVLFLCRTCATGSVCMLSCFSRVRLFLTLWTIVQQAPLSKGFSRKQD